MRHIALIAVVVLCAGSFAPANAAGTVKLAERSGFLLGVAHHCGVDSERIVDVGRRMMTLIAGNGRHDEAAQTASKRFAQFFVATSTARDDDAVTVRCDAVSAEFSRLERHTRAVAPAPSAGLSPGPG